MFLCLGFMDDECVFFRAGTEAKYNLVVFMGRKCLVHICGLNRASIYFVEPLLVLSFFDFVI